MDKPVARLLFAEDDLTLVDIYKTRFEAEGFEVMQVGDGEAALQAIRDYRPDLVVLDLMMPKMSGMRMLEILRNSPDIKDTKVLVVTALGEQEPLDRAMALGVLDYVVKSDIPLADMVATVRKHLS